MYNQLKQCMIGIASLAAFFLGIPWFGDEFRANMPLFVLLWIACPVAAWSLCLSFLSANFTLVGLRHLQGILMTVAVVISFALFAHLREVRNYLGLHFAEGYRHWQVEPEDDDDGDRWTAKNSFARLALTVLPFGLLGAAFALPALTWKASKSAIRNKEAQGSFGAKVTHRQAEQRVIGSAAFTVEHEGQKGIACTAVEENSISQAPAGEFWTRFHREWGNASISLNYVKRNWGRMQIYIESLAKSVEYGVAEATNGPCPDAPAPSAPGPARPTSNEPEQHAELRRAVSNFSRELLEQTYGLGIGFWDCLKEESEKASASTTYDEPNWSFLIDYVETLEKRFEALHEENVPGRLRLLSALVGHQKARHFFKGHESIVPANAEEERVLVALMSAGWARKEGNLYFRVYPSPPTTSRPTADQVPVPAPKAPDFSRATAEERKLATLRLLDGIIEHEKAVRFVEGQESVVPVSPHEERILVALVAAGLAKNECNLYFCVGTSPRSTNSRLTSEDKPCAGADRPSLLPATDTTAFAPTPIAADQATLFPMERPMPLFSIEEGPVGPEVEKHDEDDSERMGQDRESEAHEGTHRKNPGQSAKPNDPLHASGLRSAGQRATIGLPGDVLMRFAWCPPGSFLMGSEEEEAYSEEQPAHRVTLTKGFYMGIHPVTQAQWKSIMGSDPSKFKGLNRPVENVSWHDSQEFSRKLTGHLEGTVTIRLPSEAEWEYACRAGTTTEFHFGDLIDTTLANYDGTWNESAEDDPLERTTDVGSFPANAWGLLDMHGTVWEWCEDWLGTYEEEHQTDPVRLQQEEEECRVMRGGSWLYTPDFCRAASRDGHGPGYRNEDVGFRVCFAMPATADFPKEELALRQRRRELQLLTKTVSSCTRCPGLFPTRMQTVFGVGQMNADLCFIGEAPGLDDDAVGEPFVGAVGQLLDRIITACGMKREEVYICNILKCHPPGDRRPSPNEVANCREHFERQLELIQPKFICALGAGAAQNLLKTNLGIDKLRGRFHDYQGIPVICTYDPALLLLNPEKKPDVWEDMKILLQRMGRPIPGGE